MANLTEHCDGHIIIGVDEENYYSVSGVENDANRKTTQSLVTFLRDKNFASGIRPVVHVETLEIGSHLVDVVVIEDSINTPYYLSSNFQGVRPFHIYTRVQDTNTDITKSADPDVVEKLWRKRFGIDRTALDRAFLYLRHPEAWVDIDDETGWFYKYAPEFTVHYELIDLTGYEYYHCTQTDLDDPDFGLPMYYTVNLEWSEGSVSDESGSGPAKPVRTYRSVKIHHSRVLRFIGRELPYMETAAENYWGASELEHIWDELQKRSATSANIAQLIFQANITTLKMGDLGEHLAYGSDSLRGKVMETLTNENRLRTSYGIQLMSAEDSLETHAYTFSGLSDVYESFMMDMAGAAEIPATKLFGRSPQGMNSTGEADLRNYYDMIAQMQERHLRPALEKLLPVMAISCWGYVPDELEIVFEPVMTTSPAERAELVQKLSSDVIEAFKCGLLDREEAREELRARGEELGVYTKV